MTSSVRVRLPESLRDDLIRIAECQQARCPGNRTTLSDVIRTAIVDGLAVHQERAHAR